MNKGIESSSENVAEATASTKDIFYAPGHRFPTLRSARGFDSLSYLTDEDKRIGVEIFDQTKMINIEGVKQPPEHEAVQAINPYMIFQSDPELFAADLSYGEAMSSLCFGMNNEEVMGATDQEGGAASNPEVSHRHRMAMLIVCKVADEYKEGWTLRLMSTFPGLTLSKEQFCLLDQPRSAVWNEEERLILEFTHGVVHAKVDDELFARAEVMWGRKQLLRYAAWVTRYITLMLFNHLNFADPEKAGPAY